jgi:hypothetical protein
LFLGLVLRRYFKLFVAAPPVNPERVNRVGFTPNKLRGMIGIVVKVLKYDAVTPQGKI